MKGIGRARTCLLQGTSVGGSLDGVEFFQMRRCSGHYPTSHLDLTDWSEIDIGTFQDDLAG